MQVGNRIEPSRQKDQPGKKLKGWKVGRYCTGKSVDNHMLTWLVFEALWRMRDEMRSGDSLGPA